MVVTTEKDSFENRTGVVQWIDFLRFSLADIVARGEWDDFGLFRFLNRTSFLSTKHLIFVIYRTDEKGRLIANREISEFDPMVKDRFFQKLCDDGLARYLKTEKKYKILDKKTKDYEIPIFETDNRLLIYQVDLEYNDPGDEPTIDFIPVRKDSDIGWFFEKVFKQFDGKNGRAELLDPINRHFKALIDFSQYERAKDKVPKPGDLSQNDNAILDRCLHSMINFVDMEYKRLCNSPLLRSYACDIDKILDEKETINQENNEKDDLIVDDVETNEYRIAGLVDSPANIFIFGKIFKRDTARYKGHYYYDPVYLAKKQISHIETFLMRIYFAKTYGGKKKVKGNTEPKRSDFLRYGIKKYDDTFWRWCHSQNGHKKILGYLTKEWPSYIRIFAENILMTGAITLHPNIFENGGIGWIDKEAIQFNSDGRRNKNYQEDLDDAYMHLVCFHYIMQFASPVVPKKAKNLSLLSVPLRVSGGVWMCASVLRENIESTKLNGLINQEQFDKTYLIYHSLLRELERRLRYKGRDEYEKLSRSFVRSVVEHGHKKVLNDEKYEDEKPITKDKVVIFSKEVSKYNNYIGLITRIYPFYRLRLTSMVNERDKIDKNTIKIELENNEFFDRLILKKYITGDQTKREAYIQALSGLLFDEIKLGHKLAFRKRSDGKK